MKESIIKNTRLSAAVVRNTQVRQIFSYRAPARHNTQKSVKLHLLKEVLTKRAALRNSKPTLIYKPNSIAPCNLHPEKMKSDDAPQIITESNWQDAFT